MIDIHTHVLPGMDDGAKDADEANQMLCLLKAQGITQVVLTPHFYAWEESLSAFLQRRMAAYQKIKELEIGLYLASETRLTEEVFLCESMDDLCIPNTRALLLELPFDNVWNNRIFRQIERLMSQYGVQPIIAHVERYRAVHKNKNVLKELIDLGCLLQINTDSLVNRLTRAKTLRLIRDGWVQFIGSDCHNMQTRRPRHSEFQEILQEKLGENYAKYFHNNAKELLTRELV